MDDFGLTGRAVADFQADTRFHLVETLPPGSSRVNVQHITEITDAFDAKDVTVPANEDIRRRNAHFGCDPAAPSPGMSADVRHPEAQTLEFEALVFAGPKAYGATIHIAPDGPYWSEFFKLIEDVRRSDVAGVENQIYLTQVIGQRRMKIGVRVGENT